MAGKNTGASASAGAGSSGRRTGRPKGSVQDRVKDRPKGCPYTDIVCNDNCVSWAMCKTLRAEKSSYRSKLRIANARRMELEARFESCTPCDFCLFDGVSCDDEPCASCRAVAKDA